ncbi:TraB/GumN family protein [Aurantiacibacter sp. MUD11]|uniref:TraB/GumN family protein n=1 Tax=Aurantiacibacter sp. MUD11 TaxID=3003265 RepID=UPI0022AB47AC|nr:TraB/GumN family protein [Aurantiacibacter sp. MUD11]WAT18399.1 TraB/GumN family protein [Aurantiacibacter sp. MUD11]
MSTSILSRLLAPFALLATAFAAPLAAQQANPYAFTQDYEPAPAIWKLSDEDTTIYMLGTIHLLPEGFRWRNPQLDAIIDEADVLVVETTEEESDGMMEAISPKLANVLTSRTPTSRQLSPLGRTRWRELVAMSGMPFEYVDSLPVMVALLGFGQAGLESDPSSYEYGVETVLEREFTASGRPIESIEDFGRVMYGLFRVNDTEVVRELDMQLRAWGGKTLHGLYDAHANNLTGDAYWAMEHAWARGEVAEDFDLGFGVGTIGETFHEVLLNRRNARWAQWLEDRLDQPGTVLLAVGAGHFEGSDSVLAKLEERGLAAERIN